MEISLAVEMLIYRYKIDTQLKFHVAFAAFQG